MSNTLVQPLKTPAMSGAAPKIKIKTDYLKTLSLTITRKGQSDD